MATLRAMADDYAYQAAKTSARALAGAAGFDVVQHSCLDILAGLILRYMKELGTGSHHYAELAGRSETNPVDVTLALNDMNTSIAQLRDFLKRSPEVPFEGDIAAFPLRKASRAAPSFLERGEETAAPPHIPPWLPALPDPHTYQSTPVYAGHEQDPQKQQQLVTKQRQEAEKAAVLLQARLAADSNKLLAAKLAETEAERAAAAAAKGGGGGFPAPHEGPEEEEGGGDVSGLTQQELFARAAANPFLKDPWADLRAVKAKLLAMAADGGGGGGGAAAADAAGAGSDAAEGQEPAPEVDWDAAAAAGGAHGTAGAAAAQQVLPVGDWRGAQRRQARIATGARDVKEAFGEAYGEVAAARAGKRHKRSGNTVAAQAAAAAAAAAADPVKARVEQILAVNAPAPLVQDGVKHEQI